MEPERADLQSEAGTKPSEPGQVASSSATSHGGSERLRVEAATERARGPKPVGASAATGGRSRGAAGLGNEKTETPRTGGVTASLRPGSFHTACSAGEAAGF